MWQLKLGIVVWEAERLRDVVAAFEACVKKRDKCEKDPPRNLSSKKKDSNLSLLY